MNVSRGIVRDGRTLPFFVVTKDATARLSARFAGRQLAVARSIYFALLEFANRRGGDTGAFAASRKEIAALAGVSPRTLTEYADALEAAGVLVVERRREGEVNLPNTWTVVEPEGDADDAPLVQQPPHPPAAAAGGSGSSRQRVGQQPPPMKEPSEEPSEEQSPSGTSRAAAEPQTALALPSGDPAGMTERDPSVKPVPPEVAAALQVVGPALDRVAASKGGLAVKPAAVVAMLMARPLKPHARAVEAFEHYWLYGAGQGRKVKDAVATYRNWVDREPDMAPQAPGSAAPSATFGNARGPARTNADRVRANIDAGREVARRLRKEGPHHDAR